VVSIGCFAMSVYILAVYYLQYTAKLDYAKWDISTTTAADFTAEMTITDEMWNELLLIWNRIDEPNPTHAVPSMAETRKPVIALA
jgi:hypothetical protein